MHPWPHVPMGDGGLLQRRREAAQPHAAVYNQQVRRFARQAAGTPPRALFGFFMATTDPAVRSEPASVHRTANEFSIQVATVNGSGSQTANLILIRSLFQMGIPVSGKNLFPSNIAGLPTGYTLSAS